MRASIRIFIYEKKKKKKQVQFERKPLCNSLVIALQIFLRFLVIRRKIRKGSDNNSSHSFNSAKQERMPFKTQSDRDY